MFWPLSSLSGFLENHKGVGMFQSCLQNESCDLVLHIILKPRPNDRNMPTQLCATLLGVVGSNVVNPRNMLRLTMLQHVVLACCDRLAGALAFSRSTRRIFMEPFNSFQIARAVLTFTIMISSSWQRVEQLATG